MKHFLPFTSHPKESAVQKSKAAKMVQRMKVETFGISGNKVIKVMKLGQSPNGVSQNKLTTLFFHGFLLH